MWKHPRHHPLLAAARHEPVSPKQRFRSHEAERDDRAPCHDPKALRFQDESMPLGPAPVWACALRRRSFVALGAVGLAMAQEDFGFGPGSAN